MNPAPPKPPASSPAEPDDAAPARPDMVTGEPVRIDTVVASAYTIPTDVPEADGTFAWNDTTLVLVQVSGSGQTGTGWTYGSAVAVRLIDDVLAPALIDQQLASVPQRMGPARPSTAERRSARHRGHGPVRRRLRLMGP